MKQAKVVERLGDIANPRSISLIAIHSQDLPTVFSEAALEEAERAEKPTLEGRTDLRDIALVTIDGERRARLRRRGLGRTRPIRKIRAAGISSSRSPMSRSMSAPGSALDGEAARRGNSVYFPDRVVPMLPEALSNDLCSLAPGRGSRLLLRSHLWIDAQGRKRRHRFDRGLMRSAARLTYERCRPPTKAADDTPARCRSVIARAVWRLRRLTAPGAARRAGTRSARAPVVLDEQRRPVGDRAAHPARQPPADRGIHDPAPMSRRPRSWRRGSMPACTGCTMRRTRKSSPRLRDFLTRSAFPGSPGQGTGHPAGAVQPHPGAPPRRRRARTSSTSWSCAARRRPSTARTISAISGWRCRATRISPRRSGAMPI